MGKVWAVLLWLISAVPLLAQSTMPVTGYCNLGGAHATVSGLPAINWQQGIIPGCLVSVYLHGTSTLAPHIYADSSGSPLSSQFTANVAGSPNTGAWIFWAPVGQSYDVVGSGGTAPNNYPAPVTLTEVYLGGSGGGGTVPCGSLYDIQLNDPAGSFGCDTGIFTHNPTTHVTSTQTLDASQQVDVSDATHTGVLDFGLSNGSAVTSHYTLTLDSAFTTTNGGWGGKITGTDTGGIWTGVGGSSGPNSPSLVGWSCPPGNPGDLCYWDGTGWSIFTGNNSGNKFLLEDATGIPSWTASAPGSISSITETVPTGEFTFTGSPCTGPTCTFALGKANVYPNYLAMGPTGTAYKTPYIVQSKLCVIGDQTASWSCQFDGANTAGNAMLIAAFQGNDVSCGGTANGAGGTGTLTDSAGNALVNIYSTPAPASLVGIDSYVKSMIGGSADIITLTNSPVGVPVIACATIYIAEIANADPVNTLDGFVENGGIYTCDPFLPLTTTAAHTLIIGVRQQSGTADNLTNGVGWVLDGSDSVSPQALAAVYLNTTSSGTYTPLVTGCSSTTYDSNLAVSFKAATAGGGGSPWAFQPLRFSQIQAALSGLSGLTPTQVQGATQLDLQVGTPINIDDQTSAYAGNDAGSTLFTAFTGSSQTLVCSLAVSCHAASATSLVPSLLWTDPSSTAKKYDGLSIDCTTLAMSVPEASVKAIRVKAGSTVYFKTALTGSPHYDVGAACRIASTN